MNEYRYLAELLERYPVLRGEEKSLRAVYEMLRDCFAAGGKLLVAGNGAVPMRSISWES